MGYKEKTKEVYDRYAREFEARTKGYLPNIAKDMELFMQSLPGKRVLDLGSGPGRDALFFREMGLVPLCVDFSKSMITICREKGLVAVLMDIENLGFTNNSFDGVWAYTSLLHIPKQNFTFVLSDIVDILKTGGVLYLGMKEGNFEGELVSEKYPSMKRFFSLYTDEELRKRLKIYFNILYMSKVKLGEATFLNYLCKKKS